MDEFLLVGVLEELTDYSSISTSTSSVQQTERYF